MGTASNSLPPNTCLPLSCLRACSEGLISSKWHILCFVTFPALAWLPWSFPSLKASDMNLEKEMGHWPLRKLVYKFGGKTLWPTHEATKSGPCSRISSTNWLAFERYMSTTTFYPLCAQSKYRGLPEPFSLKTEPAVPYSMQFIIVPAHLPPDQEHTYVDIFKRVSTFIMPHLYIWLTSGFWFHRHRLLKPFRICIWCNNVVAIPDFCALILLCNLQRNFTRILLSCLI